MMDPRPVNAYPATPLDLGTMPALRRAGRLNLHHCGDLETVDLGQVEDLAWLRVAPAPALKDDALRLPSLRRVAGRVWIGGVGVESLSLPALEAVSGDLELHYNLDLAALHLPALREVGGTVFLHGHPALDPCEAERAFQDVSIGGLDTDLPACEP